MFLPGHEVKQHIERSMLCGKIILTLKKGKVFPLQARFGPESG